MNLDRVKEKLSTIAKDDAMLGRWMQRLKNKPQSVKAVAKWAAEKKDKKNAVAEFHEALRSVKKTAKFPHPQAAEKKSAPPAKRSSSRFQRQAERRLAKAK